MSLSNSDDNKAVESQTVRVIPSDGAFGADIVGFDFDALSPDQVAVVHKAWLEHKVLRFRRYEISEKQLIEFTKTLGPFWNHPAQEQGLVGAHESFENILIISNDTVAGRATGILDNDELAWHTDSCFLERPPQAALLHAIKVSESGGNTHFANMFAVYEALPDDVRRVIEGRQIQLDLLHDSAGKRRAGLPTSEHDDIRLWPNIRHPIVCTDEKTNQKFINIGSEPKTKTSWIVGLPLDESTAILNQIVSIVQQQKHHFEQVWQQGDLILWDNLSVMHRRDTWDARQGRVMHRTSTEGPRLYYQC